MKDLLKTWGHFGLDGKAALQSVVTQSAYGSIAQAVASLTVFSHPNTVAQTSGRNIFRTIRRLSQRGEFLEGQVMADDNRSPMCAFLWANKLSRLPRCDIQCNHLWSDATNVNLYTSLSNLCLTPSFLAKLTDTDSGIKMLLRYRAYEIYNGFFPPNETCPIKPADYDALVWSDSASEVFNAEQQLRNEMRTKPLDRVVISARKLGWIFSNYQPDTTL